MANLVSIKINPIDPSDMVVTVAEAKAHCNIDFDILDSQIEGWIKSATWQLQMFTGLVFLPSNVEAVYQNGRSGRIRLVFDNEINYTGDYNIEGKYICTSDPVISMSYQAGYSVTPEWCKQAVLMSVAFLFENRGEFNTEFGVCEDAKQFCKGNINYSLVF